MKSSKVKLRTGLLTPGNSKKKASVFFFFLKFLDLTKDLHVQPFSSLLSFCRTLFPYGTGGGYRDLGQVETV